MRFSLLLGTVALGVLLAPLARAADEKPAVAKEAKAAGAKAAEEKAPVVYPTALLAFEERGSGTKDLGPKVTDLLFAKLAVREELMLVDRDDLKKTLGEQELGLTGIVKTGEAAKVGQLTGAKLLVTGSVLQVDKKLFLIAKVIGTETSRVVSASAEGKAADELAPLVDKLAEGIAEAIGKQGDKLVAKQVAPADRMADLKKKMGKGKRPTVMIKVTERHVGIPVIDPAAQTELVLFLKEAGFEVLDMEEGERGKADVLISGEGLSELAGRHGNLVSVKARVEVKAVDRSSGRVVAVERQTARVVGLTEQLGGKSALQEAAATIAERLLPRLVPKEGGAKD